MGGFSVWHWLIVLCFLAVPAGVLALIVWLAVRGTRKPSAPASPRDAPDAGDEAQR